MVRENAIAEGFNEMNFAPPVVYYQGKPLNEKIANYRPPIKAELNPQALVVDTWNRGLTIPSFFYAFFMETFMVPAYTCDKMRPEDLSYPGFKETYSCYCNNGDYHTMPAMNFEVTD